MASEERRRRLDVKTQDREKSLSPLDKDQLKQRCLARVRSERSRHMARLRRQRDIAEEERVGFEIESSKLSLEVTGGQAEESSPPRRFLSSPREILRQGLSDIAVVKRQPNGGRLGQRANLLAQGGVSCSVDATVHGKRTDYGASLDTNVDPSSLLAIEEEAAYMTACSPAARAVRRSATSTGNLDSRCKEGERSQQGEQAEEMESDDLWFEDDAFADEHLLSREEYLEMMQYIEEACREEDIRAEEEVLKEYELNKRLEEEAIEAAITSGLEHESIEKDAVVLCPVCKRDYLLQAGPPSNSIVCACGFRLDTAGDRLGLEDLRQQLAETFEQHSAACNAQPGFSLEGSHGLTVLWSLCDGCGFARVVL